MDVDYERLSIDCEGEMEVIFDIFYGEEVIMFVLGFVELVRKW